MKHILLFSLTLVLVLGSGLASAKSSKFELGPDGRTNLELTVFNSNLAVVRDHREVVLPTGDIELEFTDVARTILPPTVSVTSASSKGFVASRQHYRFDLLNPHSLLERFVGRKVKYSRFLLQDTGYEKVLREGILLSINPEIVRFGDLIEIAPEGTISLPHLPEDLITSPTLVFTGNNRQSGKQELSVRYHTGGIGWEADYALTLEKEASLSGWVTIRNESSSDYLVDDLVLVAGDLNQIPVPKMMAEMQRMDAVASFSSAGPVASTPGDYHVYRFPGRVRLRKNDMTQMRLISADEITYEKTYRLASTAQRYGNQPVQESSPNVWVTIDGLRKNGIKDPLPAGNIRVYEADSGKETFIGEARIGHTSVGNRIDVPVGRAFDVFAKRTQTSFQRFGEKEAQISYRIELTNDKSDDITVAIEEQLSGDWEVISESPGGNKRDSMTYVFDLKVPGNESAAVEYTVRFRW